MKKLISKWPVTTYGLITLILCYTIDSFDIDYDENIFVTLLFILLPIVGFMFSIPSEILFSINDGKAMHYHDQISNTIGISICLILDILIRRYRTRKLLRK